MSENTGGAPAHIQKSPPGRRARGRFYAVGTGRQRMALPAMLATESAMLPAMLAAESA